MKKHILFIDDDIDELKIFLDAMKKVPGDFKCTYAHETGQAIEMLKYLIPDFIFVDFNIPKINGLQFLATIKNEIRLQGARIFLYSSRITEELIRLAKSLGAVDCIQKTNTINMLAVELKSALSETGRINRAGNLPL